MVRTESWGRSLSRDGVLSVLLPGHADATTAQPREHYPPDTGCEIAPHCLECPLPACKLDLPPKVGGMLMRRMRLADLLASGLTMDEAAVQMGVCRRTVYRLKASMRSAG